MTYSAAWMIFGLLSFAAVWMLEYHEGHIGLTIALAVVFVVLRANAWWNARERRPAPLRDFQPPRPF
jgi:hypothetical protein